MLRELATQRVYRFPDGRVWQVQNDYWEITCGSCENAECCRLTVIKRRSPDARSFEERHLNFASDVGQLQRLHITYEPYDQHPEHAIVEVFLDERWCLAQDGVPVAEQEASASL